MELDIFKELCEEFVDEDYKDTVVKFGGAGSWYNLPTNQDIQTWKKVMNDSRKIYSGFAAQPYGMYQSYSQPSTNWDTQGFYEKEKAKLVQIAKESCDIFITHVALNTPTLEQGMNPEYDGDAHNIFYYTDNLDLVKQSGAKIHIHGHTHQHLDYIQDDVQVICNPLGYPSDNTYSKVKQIEV